MLLACRATISDGLGVEESRAVTLQLHERVRARAAQVGGYVAELHAESVSVYFGYPRSQEHAEEHACTLALAIVEDAAQLGGQAGAPAEAGGAVTIHAGIHAARLRGACHHLTLRCCTL